MKFKRKAILAPDNSNKSTSAETFADVMVAAPQSDAHTPVSHASVSTIPSVEPPLVDLLAQAVLDRLGEVDYSDHLLDVVVERVLSLQREEAALGQLQDLTHQNAAYQALMYQNAVCAETNAGVTTDGGQRIMPQPPRIGLIIGTYAAVPYIHLQLESWRRHCQDMALLVHDDCSPQWREIRALCRDYGAEFSTNSSRLGHVVGDMVVFEQGLEWAVQRKIDLLVKFSRRFVPLVEWQSSLTALACESQFATYSSLCQFHGFGFRTEALAMHVHSWLTYGGLGPIQAQIAIGSSDLVEAVVHAGAQKVHSHACSACQKYEAAHPSPHDASGYAHWPLMGNNRCQPRADLLWHESCRPAEYHRALLQYGIRRYSEDDFEDAAANIRA